MPTMVQNSQKILKYHLFVGQKLTLLNNNVSIPFVELWTNVALNGTFSHIRKKLNCCAKIVCECLSLRRLFVAKCS